MTATVSDKMIDLSRVEGLNTTSDDNDGVSVIHEGRIGWWHRLTERFTVLCSLHRINHRVYNKLRTIRFLKSGDVRLVIILLSIIILGAIAGIAAIIGDWASCFFILFIVVFNVCWMLSYVESDDLTSSLVIPRGLIMATTMNDQPFIVTVKADLDDARIICDDDKGRLKAKYTRHSRTIQSGDLSGAVVYSPCKISDEDMTRITPRMEQAVWRYTAERCNTTRDGEKLDAPLAPSDTLDGFDESATDEKHVVTSMDAALSTRLWVMRNSVLDARRIGDALKLEHIHETCDSMNGLIDDVAEHWQDWKQYHGDEHDDATTRIDDEYYDYCDSINDTMQQLETRITGLTKMLNALAADHARARELTENLDSLSDSIAGVYNDPVMVSAL